MRLAKASIGRKLLFSFSAMALLVLLSALIGVLGFSLVAKTERDVVNNAIPSMIEARQVAELSHQIIASVQTLSNAKNEQEHQAAGQKVFSQLETLLTHIQQLGEEAFDSVLLDRLEQDVQNVIDTLAQLGRRVEHRLTLENQLISSVKEMRKLAQELEQLTRTQVLNTSTIAVANVTHIYDLLQKQQQAQVYQALDNLVEVDLDLAERLHELHLLAFKVLNEIEETQTVTDLERILALDSEFAANLSIMQRRVQAVEDPTRSKQMIGLLRELEKRRIVFELLKQRYSNEQAAQQLLQGSLTQFAKLNNTVNQLVDASNQVTTTAVSKLSNTLYYAQLILTVLGLLGLVIVVWIVWKVVYRSVIQRLDQHTAALLSVAKGQLEVEISTQGNDELGQMGQAIAHARDTAKALKVVVESEVLAKRELQQHKEHLEELVEQRTHQLSEMNHKLNQEVLNHAKARYQAEQASRAKSAFLATMSHEIRTPMNGVLGTARLLQETSLTSTQQHYVQVINRSGRSLLAILNDVLDYSKIEAGHLEIHQTDFDLYRLVRETYDLMQSRALEKGISLTYHIDEDVTQYWQGDEIRIGQVLNNLVGNAIKFTEQGEVRISIRLGLDGQGIRFAVEDSGTGIAEEEQATLFDAFTQAEAGRRKQGGTGLGLAISRKLVQAMGGELQLASQLGQGSCFWFTLPLAVGQPVETPALAVDDVPVAKVLLVEDNEVNCLVAQGFLTGLGHQVTLAKSVQEAKLCFQQQRFDIALLDIHLPDGNGVDLLRDLRQMEDSIHNAVIPFIAVSAHVFNEDVAGYLAAGFDGYLPKPLVKEQLAVMLRRQLTGRGGHDVDGKSQHEFSTVKTSALTEDVAVLDKAKFEQDVQILGVEKMREIVGYFEQGCAEFFVICEAQKDNDAQIKSQAHKLKGSAGALWLTALYQLCQQIEQADSPAKAFQASPLVEAVEHAKSALVQTLSDMK
ncbi:TMAO reductase system sensor histidine kinase/response regulator TorS [Vibrio tarriae]|uniref:TMAO reductase system sensor histidine kinase/response regulator TorS n=1 Tax=Vibrio tarriae TaxID=2014742 RepID=UPI000DE3CC65|nr:TMAO reductase system sensor histidine kinase/response regulator TorS [Vibrio tarriae]EJL6337498.1 TMAO reductase system sensor histidine kinase/response regulator TorS [Vibrio cholerae]RBM32673.1 TMAO reductase system sensor histidine kinase/response regulator TorS [Vibrio tarriae]